MHVGKIIGVVVTLVIGLVMTPLVIDTVAGITATGMAATVLDMIPVFYVLFLLGIAAYALKGEWGKKGE